MSSYHQFLEDSISNQVHDSSSSSCFHGFSKSQMYLQKILSIIASYPSHETSKKSSFNAQILDFQDNNTTADGEGGGGGGGGVGIDLNRGLLCSSPEIQEDDDQSECLLTGYNCSVFDSEVDCLGFTAEKIPSEEECDALPGEKVSDAITNILETNGKEQELVKSSPDFQEQELKSCENDCFSLLIEAAEMVSDHNNLEIKDEKEKESETMSGVCRGGGSGLSSRKSNDGKCSRVVDISPMARSRRGRSQVLPSRYRDSILLAPWKRPPPPSRVKRPAAAAPIVSKKRGNNNKQVNK